MQNSLLTFKSYQNEFRENITEKRQIQLSRREKSIIIPILIDESKKEIEDSIFNNSLFSRNLFQRTYKNINFSNKNDNSLYEGSRNVELRKSMKITTEKEKTINSNFKCFKQDIKNINFEFTNDNQFIISENIFENKVALNKMLGKIDYKYVNNEMKTIDYEYKNENQFIKYEKGFENKNFNNDITNNEKSLKSDSSNKIDQSISIHFESSSRSGLERQSTVKVFEGCKHVITFLSTQQTMQNKSMEQCQEIPTSCTQEKENETNEAKESTQTAPNNIFVAQESSMKLLNIPLNIVFSLRYRSKSKSDLENEDIKELENNIKSNLSERKCTISESDNPTKKYKINFNDEKLDDNSNVLTKNIGITVSEGAPCEGLIISDFSGKLCDIKINQSSSNEQNATESNENDNVCYHPMSKINVSLKCTIVPLQKAEENLSQGSPKSLEPLNDMDIDKQIQLYEDNNQIENKDENKPIVEFPQENDIIPYQEYVEKKPDERQFPFSESNFGRIIEIKYKKLSSEYKDVQGKNLSSHKEESISKSISLKELSSSSSYEIHNEMEVKYSKTEIVTEKSNEITENTLAKIKTIQSTEEVLEAKYCIKKVSSIVENQPEKVKKAGSSDSINVRKILSNEIESKSAVKDASEGKDVDSIKEERINESDMKYKKENISPIELIELKSEKLSDISNLTLKNEKVIQVDSDKNLNGEEIQCLEIPQIFLDTKVNENKMYFRLSKDGDMKSFKEMSINLDQSNRPIFKIGAISGKDFERILISRVISYEENNSKLFSEQPIINIIVNNTGKVSFEVVTDESIGIIPENIEVPPKQQLSNIIVKSDRASLNKDNSTNTETALVLRGIPEEAVYDDNSKPHEENSKEKNRTLEVVLKHYQAVKMLSKADTDLKNNKISSLESDGATKLSVKVIYGKRVNSDIMREKSSYTNQRLENDKVVTSSEYKEVNLNDICITEIFVEEKEMGEFVNISKQELPIESKMISPQLLVENRAAESSIQKSDTLIIKNGIENEDLLSPANNCEPFVVSQSFEKLNISDGLMLEKRTSLIFDNKEMANTTKETVSIHEKIENAEIKLPNESFPIAIENLKISNLNEKNSVITVDKNLKKKPSTNSETFNVNVTSKRETSKKSLSITESISHKHNSSIEILVEIVSKDNTKNISLKVNRSVGNSDTIVEKISELNTTAILDEQLSLLEKSVSFITPAEENVSEKVTELDSKEKEKSFSQVITAIEQKLLNDDEVKIVENNIFDENSDDMDQSIKNKTEELIQNQDKKEIIEEISLQNNESQIVDNATQNIMEEMTNEIFELFCKMIDNEQSNIDDISNDAISQSLNCDKDSSEKLDDSCSVPIINLTTHLCFNSKSPIKIGYHEEHNNMQLHKSMDPKYQYKLTNNCWSKSEIFLPENPRKSLDNVCLAIDKICKKEYILIVEKIINIIVNDYLCKTEKFISHVLDPESAIPRFSKGTTKPQSPFSNHHVFLCHSLPNSKNNCIPNPYGYTKQRNYCTSQIPHCCFQKFKKEEEFQIPKDGIFGRNPNEPKFVNFCCNVCGVWFSLGDKADHMEKCMNNNMSKVSTDSPRSNVKPTGAKRMPGIICYICGKRFTKHTLLIHEKSCLAKWVQINNQLDQRNRKSFPIKPDISDSDIVQRINEQVGLGNIAYSAEDARNDFCYIASRKNAINLIN